MEGLFAEALWLNASYKYQLLDAPESFRQEESRMRGHTEGLLWGLEGEEWHSFQEKKQRQDELFERDEYSIHCNINWLEISLLVK